MSVLRNVQSRLVRLMGAQAALDHQLEQVIVQMEELSRRLDAISKLLENTDPQREHD